MRDRRTRRVGAGVALTIVALVTAFGASASRAGALVPRQAISGLAQVRYEEFNGSLYSASGWYTTSGQLGRGTIAMTHRDSGGTRFDLVRSDGTALTGGSSYIPLTATLKGNSDVKAVDLTLKEVSNVPDLAHSHPGDVFSTKVFVLSGWVFPAHPIGYAMTDGTGHVTALGGLGQRGDAHTSNVARIESTPTHKGYWIVNSAGQVFAFGDAPYRGGASPSALAAGESVTSMSASRSGHGYWLFTSKGRALAFGDAPFFGDMHTLRLNAPVVGSVATPTGKGYYMVARDGGIFTFGDARFHGSTGAMTLNRPVIALVPTPDKLGYWLVASDGGVFTFNAPFRGSLGAFHIDHPVVAMVAYGDGYLMATSDGRAYSFSSSPVFGDVATAPNRAIVSATAVG